jgi:proteasome alpha subunit
VSMPYYVSPEQVTREKADYVRKRITQIRSGVVLSCEAGILFVAPNPYRALRKFSELYDRIAFAAVGRYNEFETLRKAGVRYADATGFQYDRRDVTARGLADWYAQLLGTLFTDSPKPYEVEIVVAEVGNAADDDQLYRIIFDGSVAEERGFVVMGGQAERVAAVIKERYSEAMPLAEAMHLSIDSLAGQDENNGPGPMTADQLEAAILDRSRTRRAFRRLTGQRLEALLVDARSAAGLDGKAQGGSTAEAAETSSAEAAGTAADEAGGAGEKGTTDGAGDGGADGGADG